MPTVRANRTLTRVGDERGARSIGSTGQPLSPRALAKEIRAAHRVGLTIDEIVEIFRLDRPTVERLVSRAGSRRPRWLRSA